MDRMIFAGLQQVADDATLAEAARALMGILYFNLSYEQAVKVFIAIDCSR